MFGIQLHKLTYNEMLELNRAFRQAKACYYEMLDEAPQKCEISQRIDGVIARLRKGL